MLAGALFATGCASQQVRVDQFAAFAATGTAFTKTVDPVLTESFDATATTSSLVLLQSRDALSQSERLQYLQTADEDLNARLAILRDLKRHLGVLQSYFDTLAALAATTSQSSGMTGVAQNLVDALGKLNARFANANIGGEAVASLVAPATEFVFVAHQSRVLNEELKRHAAVIDHEIRLQQAALQALAEAYAADLQVVASKTYRDEVAMPYAGAGALGSGWSTTRADLLQSKLDTTAIQAAANAATSLRIGFVALVENRLGSDRIAALQADLDSILSAIESSRAARAATNTDEVPQS
ncbi:MAG: hypothetical protein M3Q42_14100 [Pseudomonadota bacterium]|nr:hypothetical protein [Pseudomonadota bacterium]